MPKKGADDKDAVKPAGPELAATLLTCKALLEEQEQAAPPSSEGAPEPLLALHSCENGLWPGRDRGTEAADHPCVDTVKVASYADGSFLEVPQVFKVLYKEPTGGKNDFSALGLKVTVGGKQSGSMYVEEPDGTWLECKEGSPLCKHGRKATLVVWYTCALKDAPNPAGSAGQTPPSPTDPPSDPGAAMHGGIKQDLAPDAKRRRVNSQASGPAAKAVKVHAKFQGFRLGAFDEVGKFEPGRLTVVCAATAEAGDVSTSAYNPLLQICIKSFQLAVKEGHIVKMRRLLPLLPNLGIRRPADLTCDTQQGWTALALAGKHCRHDVAEYLLTEAKADPNQRLKNGSTPLHRAVYYGGDEIYADAGDVGAVKMMQLLVSHGADINLATNECSWTPLHNASAQMNQEGLEYLLRELWKQAREKGEAFQFPRCACRYQACKRKGSCTREQGCAYALLPLGEGEEAAAAAAWRAKEEEEAALSFLRP